MIVRKSFRYRLYPTPAQEASLAVQFGHSRFVYNHFLQVRQAYYAAHREDPGKKGLSYEDTSQKLTALKKTPECEWLRQADSQVLQASLRESGAGLSSLLCRAMCLSEVQEEIRGSIDPLPPAISSRGELRPCSQGG